MTIFQIIAILFGLFMLYVISIHGKKKTLSVSEVSFWTSLWLVFILISLFPYWLEGISGVLNFSRVFDLLIVVAFMILSLLLFFCYFRQKETASQVEKLTRQMALYQKQHLTLMRQRSTRRKSV